jgi:hypothetical protein
MARLPPRRWPERVRRRRRGVTAHRRIDRRLTHHRRLRVVSLRLSRRSGRLRGGQTPGRLPAVACQQVAAEFGKRSGCQFERGNDLFSFPGAQREDTPSKPIGGDDLAAQGAADKASQLQHLPIIDWNSAEQHRSYLGESIPRPGCYETLVGSEVGPANLDIRRPGGLQPTRKDRSLRKHPG